MAQGLIHLSHEDLKALLLRRGQRRHLAEGTRAVASLEQLQAEGCWKTGDLTKETGMSSWDFMGFQRISWGFMACHGILRERTTVLFMPDAQDSSSMTFIEGPRLSEQLRHQRQIGCAGLQHLAIEAQVLEPAARAKLKRSVKIGIC